MSGDRPTADDVRSFVRGIAERDFSEHDALLMVIGSHGREGHIWAWPNPGEDRKSGPVALRDEIFALFQSPLYGEASTACRTLGGKPKLFLVDACRSANRDGSVTHVEDPQRPAAGPGRGRRVRKRRR